MPHPDILSQALRDGVGYPFCVFDTFEKIVLSNDEFERLLGVRDLAGLTLAGIFESTEFRTLVPGIRAGLKGGKPEPHVVTIEGFPTRHYQAAVKPIIDAGRVVLAVITLADITDKVESIKFANKAREFYNQVFDEMPVFYLLLDEEFSILRANRSARAAFGYAPDELLGAQMPDLLTFSDSDHEWHQIKQTRKTGQSVFRPGGTGEVSGKRKDGSLFPVSVSLIPSDLAEIVTYSVIIIDLTEDRRREEMRLEQEKKLQAMMRNEALGKLAGKFAHDMNNVLAVISGYAELLGLAPRAEDIQSIFEINQGVKRAGNLTTRILAYTGRQQLVTATVDVKTFIANRALLWQDALGETIQVEIVVSPQPAFVRADDKMLLQIMLSVLSNSREAMVDGGQVIIEVNTREIGADFFKRKGIDGQSGNFVELRLCDTGPGIPEDKVQQIFEPFYSTKGPNQSSGFGLAVVFGIVKQHGGYIFAENNAEKGAAMCILLPAIDGAADAWEEETLHPEINPADHTVLVVDDEDRIVDVLKTALTHAGFQVFTAPDGEMALQWFESYTGTLDLLVTDVVMPGISGIELAESLLQIDPGLVVIFITGYSQQIIDQHPVLRHFPIIQKPFSARGVVATAMKQIARRKAQSQPE